jgi:predicted nucleic acid-binding protein
VAALPIIPDTEQTAYGHARVWADLQSEGKVIGAYDLIVAATLWFNIPKPEQF